MWLIDWCMDGGLIDDVCTPNRPIRQAQLEFKDDRIRKFETIVNARSTSTSTSSAGGSNDADGKRHGGSNGNSEGEPVRLQVAKSCQTLEQSHAVIRVLFDMLVTTRREVRIGWLGLLVCVEMLAYLCAPYTR